MLLFQLKNSNERNAHVSRIDSIEIHWKLFKFVIHWQHNAIYHFSASKFIYNSNWEAASVKSDAHTRTQIVMSNEMSKSYEWKKIPIWQIHERRKKKH